MGHATSTGRATRARQIAAMAILAVLTMGAQAQGSALRSQEGAYPQHTAAEYALTNNRGAPGGLRVFGDYYFFDGAPGNLGPTLRSLVGGLRASTGLVGLSQPLSLYDALSLCELRAKTDPARYERAALRWLVRYIDERLPPLTEVALAASALAELRHGRRAAGVDALKRLIRRS